MTSGDPGLPMGSPRFEFHADPTRQPNYIFDDSAVPVDGDNRRDFYPTDSLPFQLLLSEPKDPGGSLPSLDDSRLAGFSRGDPGLNRLQTEYSREDSGLYSTGTSRSSTDFGPAVGAGEPIRYPTSPIRTPLHPDGIVGPSNSTDALWNAATSVPSISQERYFKSPASAASPPLSPLRIPAPSPLQTPPAGLPATAVKTPPFPPARAAHPVHPAHPAHPTHPAHLAYPANPAHPATHPPPLTPAPPETPLPAARKRSVTFAPPATPLQPPPPLPSVIPSLPSSVLIDMHALTSVLQFEATRRRQLKWSLEASIYFVLVACISALLMDTSEARSMSRLVHDEFVKPPIDPALEGASLTLETVASVEDVWGWLTNVWAPALFRGCELAAVTAQTQCFVRGYSVVAVTPTLRTQRREPEPRCRGSAVELADARDYCHAQTPSTAATSSGLAPTTGFDVYGEGGPGGEADNFYAFFRTNAAAAPRPCCSAAFVHNVSGLAGVAAALADLKNLEFFGPQNTFLEAPVALYNPYYKLAAHAVFRFEINGAGHVDPVSPGGFLHVTRLERYATAADSVRFVLELAFIIATFVEALFLYAQIRRARRRGASVLAYFTSQSWAWNWFEVVHVLVALTVFALHARMLIIDPTVPANTFVLDGLLSFKSRHALSAAARAMDCVLLTLTAIKIVRHLAWVPQWTLFYLTFARIVPPLFVFLVLLFTVSLGWAAAGYYTLAGTASPAFSSFAASWETTLSYFFGDVDFFDQHAVRSDPTRGFFPAVFWFSVSFVFRVVCVGVAGAVAVVSFALAKRDDAELKKVRKAARELRQLAPRTEWWGSIPGAFFLDQSHRNLLEVFGREGKKWLIPLMVDYKATSKLIAEVGGGSLRVYLCVQRWFRRKLIGARGLAVVLPPGCLVAGTNYRSLTGRIAKLRSGQAIHLTTEPILGADTVEFSVEGNTLITKGEVDLGTADGHEVVVEFPRVISKDFAWPNSEIVASTDTVQRVAAYGGCFTHTPADWIVCTVGQPNALMICPYLIREPFLPIEDLIAAVEHSDVASENDDQWRHKITTLAQMFSHTVDRNLYAPTGPSRVNPLDVEKMYKRQDTS
ncbi:hypothetical protein DIPPA_11204 [Diplonema papillatum]|nr:hypothetical protein DIPPA_09033 [Diplonema papillatum]KAJ9460134.1 hypothetical protein DIPPA_11204 [Diplonema papillatum]